MTASPIRAVFSWTILAGLAAAGLVFWQQAPSSNAPDPVSVRPDAPPPASRETALTETDSAGDADPPVQSPGDSPSPDAQAIPIDLTRFYRMKASSFDSATQFPWKAVPRGAQKFANIPLQLDGALFLWGERNATMGHDYPKQIAGIPLARTCETLYLYHAAFFEGPPGTPVCEIRFQYVDGLSATDRILCDEDVRDWFVKSGETRIGPAGKRSTLAWSGTSEKGQSLRYCLTAVDNPRPAVAVASIDLVSCETRTAACILGITVGKAGLLARMDEAKPATDEP